MVPVETLKSLDVFSGLTEFEMMEVARVCDTQDYPSGTMVFRENDDADRLYVLLAGRVAIQFEVGRHQDAVVHTSEAGQAFGWSALVQPYRFTASARCMSDSKILTVDREGLRALLSEDCHIGFIIMEKLAEIISKRLRETRIQLISMIHG
ncbi:MAG: cyclic nucleotide-binding domain-containing protein [Nitrospirae bacterium]|nr:cyclic nucleotide-binding domain-containing protein [Nitrospirota bacterium]